MSGEDAPKSAAKDAWLLRVLGVDTSRATADAVKQAARIAMLFKPVPAGRQVEIARQLAAAVPGSTEATRLVAEFAREATHVKEPATQVVLGKWERPGEGGYNDIARLEGGVWYETADRAYDAMGRNPELAWETNRAFLQQQLDAGIPRFDFKNVDVDQVMRDEAERETLGDHRPPPARVREIAFLHDNAPAYGYQRRGNAWIKLEP